MFNSIGKQTESAEESMLRIQDELNMFKHLISELSLRGDFAVKIECKRILRMNKEGSD